MKQTLETSSNVWQVAWQDATFRKKIIQSFSASALALVILPFFFDFIQSRPGATLNDWLLPQVPAQDVSKSIFTLLWGTGVFLLWRVWQQPKLAVPFLAGYALLTYTRMVTILLFPLEPPAGLIELADPISNQFYGQTFITKDLFFSGHTSAVFLFAFSLVKPRERFIVGICGVLVGILVLVQHVHYTIDVVVAPFATYLIHRLAKKWAEV
ncbi:MAG: phosphatase PAP2 family protein [Runella slithyformis]|nr:MAG: phosphatase PAP2 family protein [Runella slithyformis]TAF95079.1 MAG: phosphatase PAP2 family protein [Runella sp.]TAG18413.1 MAG: phosphatase PAP2 family protein [Cytophagales bacterium]TAG37931.1 MAG: phosphatase PAP2 family protein [Cytophagia bacterium]TAF00596.1 MAG: phosphatase PAP2 family protein [Runella slithyformis]